jgi:5-methylcytosine-specific restriction endonuclease McrA
LNNFFGESGNSPQYKKSLSATHWRKLRNQIIKARGRKCERCGYAYFSENLSLHHKHYDNIGNETIADVELLCKKCHGIADLERIKQTDRKNESKLYEAQLYGWAKKVYGEGGYDRIDIDSVSEKFTRWLDRKGGY